MAARVHPDAAQHAAQQAEQALDDAAQHVAQQAEAFDDAAQQTAKQAEQKLDDAAQKVEQKVDNVLDKARLKAVDLGNEKLNLRDVREALCTTCNEHPELMDVAIEAWDSFGMGGFKDTLKAGVNNIAQKAKGELKAQAEAGKLQLQSTAKIAFDKMELDELGDAVGDNEILKAFLSIMGPFLAQGGTATLKKYKKDPLTYDEKRGLELHEAIPLWKWVMGPFWWLGGGTSEKKGDATEAAPAPSPAPAAAAPPAADVKGGDAANVNPKGKEEVVNKGIVATVFLLASFCINLWVLAVYNLFTDGDTGECCQWMLPRWNAPDSDTDALTQILSFTALLMLPFAIVSLEKLAMNTATLPVCGALVAQLEEHYAPDVLEELWGGNSVLRCTRPGWLPCEKGTLTLTLTLTVTLTLTL